jgi:hypothetical protein
MDATPNVEPLKPELSRRGARITQPSAAAVRQEIYSTLHDLHARVEALHQYVESRFGSIEDPMHIRERIQARPIRACTVALVVGAACGALRAHRLPLVVVGNAISLSQGVVRAAIATFGSKVASDLVGRAISSRWGIGGES